MKTEIYIPTELSDLTLSQYQRYAKLDPDLDERYLNQQIVKIFAGVKRPEIIKADDVLMIVNNVKKALSQEGKLINRFFLNGVEYGMIPDLENMSYGEFIDLDENLSEWETFHKAMAVLYRPITIKDGKFYKIEKYKPNKEKEDIMLDAPMDVCYSAIVFFWTLQTDLLKHSQSSLENLTNIQMKELTSLLGDNSMLSGDTLIQLTGSLVGMLQSMKPSLIYPSPYAIPSLVLKTKNPILSELN